MKETARSAVFRPAMDIAEDALLETRDQEVVSRPKKALLKRVANRARANLRPEEPKTLDFEVCANCFVIFTKNILTSIYT